MFVRLITLSITVFLLWACSKEQLAVEKNTSPEQASSAGLNLQINKSAKLNGLNIEFMELVGDSRCPKGVQCSWAGNAQAVFLITGKSSAETVTLNTHGGDKYSQSAYVAGYEITLKDIKPYPATNIKIDPSQYMAQVSLIEKDAPKPKFVIIDVRSEREFNLGHYPKAENLDYKTIDKTIESLGLAKDSKIYVYCRSGNRSKTAKAMLESVGYTNIIDGVNQDKMHELLGTRVKM